MVPMATPPWWGSPPSMLPIGTVHYQVVVAAVVAVVVAAPLVAVVVVVDSRIVISSSISIVHLQYSDGTHIAAACVSTSADNYDWWSMVGPGHRPRW